MEYNEKTFKAFPPNAVTMIGIPSDENSSFMRGSALAPPKIREVLRCGAANLYSELGVNIDNETLFCDCGDLNLEEGKKGFEQIESGIIQLLKQGGQVLSLGGDHAVTYPIIKAFSHIHQKLTILQFDAHSDTYDEYEGNRLSHASPFARIMEEKLASRLIQVGIRTLTDHIRDQVKRFGIEVVEARNFDPGIDLKLTGPLYISLDLDVLDPGFVPGVSHHEPGGLTVRDVVNLIHGIKVPIVGADIVEFNPGRDVSDMTAMVAAKFIKELAGKMIQQKHPGSAAIIS
ncbi:agmatinase [bacterium]|nr:agmatinase [bacterium]